MNFCTNIKWFIGLNPLSRMWSTWFRGTVDSKRHLATWASTTQAYFVFMLVSVLPLDSFLWHPCALSDPNRTWHGRLFWSFQFFLRSSVISSCSSYSRSKKRCLSACEHCRALVSPSSVIAFLVSCSWNANRNLKQQIIEPSSCLNLCRSLPRAQKSLKRFLFRKRELRESFPWLR